MPRKHEKEWQESKNIVKKERDKSESDFTDKDWGLVQHITQNKTKSSKLMERKQGAMDLKQTEKSYLLRAARRVRLAVGQSMNRHEYEEAAKGKKKDMEHAHTEDLYSEYLRSAPAKQVKATAIKYLRAAEEDDTLGQSSIQHEKELAQRGLEKEKFDAPED